MMLDIWTKWMLDILNKLMLDILNKFNNNIILNHYMEDQHNRLQIILEL